MTSTRTFKFKKTTATRKDLTPKKGRVLYWDQGGHGFGLRCTARGRRVWFQNFRLHGKQRGEDIGEATGKNAMSLDVARLEAEKIRTRVKEERLNGVKPEDDAGAAAVLTFRDFADQWMEDFVTIDVKSAPDIRRYVFEAQDAIGDVRLTDVSRKDVYDMVEKKGLKTGRAAQLLLHYTKAVLDHAASKGEIDANPAASLTASKVVVKDAYNRRRELKSNKRSRFLSPTEVKGLWSLPVEKKGRGSETLLIKIALQLILVTGQRGGEVIGMREDELHDDDRYWVVPAERRGKTGKANVVWLSDLARELIAEARKHSRSREFLFSTGKAKEGHIDVNALSRVVLRERANLGNSDVRTRNDLLDYNPDGQYWRPHDLRRTASTGINELGFDADDVERALGHSVPGVKGVYDRSPQLKQQRKMFAKWDEQLRKWIDPPTDPEEGGTADNVVALRA